MSFVEASDPKGSLRRLVILLISPFPFLSHLSHSLCLYPPSPKARSTRSSQVASAIDYLMAIASNPVRRSSKRANHDRPSRRARCAIHLSLAVIHASDRCWALFGGPRLGSSPPLSCANPVSVHTSRCKLEDNPINGGETPLPRCAPPPPARSTHLLTTNYQLSGS